MNRKKKLERAAMIAVPAILTLALAFACVWGAQQSARAEEMERGVQGMYRQAYYSLCDNVNDMQTSLKKLLVVSSSQQHVLLLSDVWRLSGAAVSSLCNVPLSHVDTERVNRFLVQSGDYAHVLSRRLLNGETVSQEDREQLLSLYEASRSVSDSLTDALDRGELPVESVTQSGYYTAAAEGENAGEAGGSGESGGAGAGEGGKDEDSAANYPTLIYDGPFSESNEKAEPRGLSGGEVDANAALLAAMGYLGAGSKLALTGEVNGLMPVYTFSGTDAEGRQTELAVTKQGGQVLWMMAEAYGAEEGVPDESMTAQYRDAAKAYLDARGYSGMRATYAQYYAGTAVLNFAATQDEVILYSDLVKVYVERQSGKIVGVDANNYLFSHTRRTLPDVLLTPEEARGSVSEALEVEQTALCFIPKTASTELLCYEFKGRCRDADFIVYVNAQTGVEEEIFEIINSDEGQLVV